MNLGITGKKALVTGAGRGIGESIAINLVKEGVKTAIVSRTESDLKELLKKMGGRAKGHYMIACDLTKEDAPKKVIIARLGGRRTCSKCSWIFHIKNIPPKKEDICDRCNGALLIRKDKSFPILQRHFPPYLNLRVHPISSSWNKRIIGTHKMPSFCSCVIPLDAVDMGVEGEVVESSCSVVG